MLEHRKPHTRIARLLSLARLAVVAGVLVWLAVSLDWGSTWRLLQRTDPLPVAAAVMLTLGAVCVNALRWYLLLRVDGRAPAFGAVARMQLAGQFASNVLPTSFGGDTYRVHLLARSGYGYAQAAASVGVDRFLGACVLFGLALWGAIVSLSSPGISGAALALGAALFVCLVGLGSLAAIPPWRRLLERTPWIGAHAHALLTLSGAYLRERNVVAAGLVLSLIGNAATVGKAYLLVWAVGAEVFALEVAAATMVVLGVSALPVSISGYGITEAGWVLLLPNAGLEPHVAAGVAILWRGTKIVVSLLAGLALLTPGSQPVRAQTEPPR